MSLKKIILLIFVGHGIADSTKAQIRSYPANSLQESYMILSNLHGINTERFYPQEYKSLKANWGFDTVVRNYNQLTLLPHIRTNQPHQYFTYAHPNFSLMPQYTPGFLRFLKPLGKKTILTTPAWFYSWIDKSSSNKGSFFVVNPILHTEFSPRTPYSSRYLNNTKGIELFGQISNDISFSTQLVESQFHFQNYITRYQDTFGVTPNAGFWKKNLFGYSDFYRARANIYANVVNSANSKTHVLLSIGHDNHQIGNGYRSLLISNFSPATLYLKFNIRLGPLRYQSLYQELYAMDQQKQEGFLLPKKHMAMHRVSLEFPKPVWINKKNVEKLENWIEVGLSEMILQTRSTGGLDFNYWNPIIFYRSIERDLGSPDNVLIMFDGKIRQKNAMFYAQFLLDEFSIGQLFQGNNWVNKHGYQIGSYIKPNINSIFPKFGSIVVQVEVNSVRPFTYSHLSKDANAVNYNQALAHPLESNFRELNFSVRYKPVFIRGFLFTHTTFFAVKGFDYSTTGANYGGNIRRDYNTRIADKNVKILQGEVGNIVHSKTQVFYELMPNMWMYLASQFRVQTGHQPSREYYTYLGLRWNWYEELQLF